MGQLPVLPSYFRVLNQLHRFVAQISLSQSEEHVRQLEGLVKEARAGTDKVQKECNALAEKVSKLHHDLEEQIHANT